jgi:hypothetical protein
MSSVRRSDGRSRTFWFVIDDSREPARAALGF